MTRTDFEKAVELADHYIAIGQTEIYLDKPDDALWQHVTKVDAGSCYRLGAPIGLWVYAIHPCGLTFRWSVDFESPTANGTGTAAFDRERMRDVAMRLPPPARDMFRRILSMEVLPKLEERTEEIRSALNKQLDSEDCVRGLIAFLGVRR